MHNVIPHFSNFAYLIYHWNDDSRNGAMSVQGKSHNYQPTEDRQTKENDQDE